MALNYSITIQQTTQTRGTYGGITDSWATLCTCWADVQQVSGNEGFTSDMVVYSDVKKFIIHYEEGKDVTAKMRIEYDDEYYYITSISHKGRLQTELLAIRHDDE